MTTTSLHGSSSSLAFPTPSRNCKRGGGLLGCRGCRWRQMTMASLHGSSSLSSFVDLKKKKRKKTHPVSQLQARGWVGSCWKEETHPGLQLHARGWAFVIVVVGADGCRCHCRCRLLT